MTAPAERRVSLPSGIEARVWEKGEGEPLGFLGGLHGLPTWIPFLDRLAESRRVVAPSLPGQTGGSGHEALGHWTDWIASTLDLLDATGLEGADLVGASLGGMFAAEVAAFSRGHVRRLVLIAPLGLVDAADGGPRLPDAGDAGDVAGRILGPSGDRGLARRLHRIHAPTLLLVGDEDGVLPAGYAKRFADRLGGLVRSICIEGAGHRVEIDAPDAAAAACLEFLPG